MMGFGGGAMLQVLLLCLRRIGVVEIWEFPKPKIP